MFQVPVVTVIFDIGSLYSCLISDLTFEWQWGCRWPCLIKTSMFLLCNYKSGGSYVNYLAIRKAEKYVSRWGHLQPRLLAFIGQVTKHTIDHFTVVCSVTWPFNGSEAGVTLFWYRPHCFWYVNQVVLMLTRRIYMANAARSVSKKGQLQPRCHSKARSPRLLVGAIYQLLVNQ